MFLLRFVLYLTVWPFAFLLISLLLCSLLLISCVLGLLGRARRDYLGLNDSSFHVSVLATKKQQEKNRISSLLWYVCLF